MDLSIIIPVYNVEKYLKKCIDSVLNMNDIDYEIILINDGSTDNSKMICEEYEQSYPYIHLINKKNSGLSDARNVGLTKAKGEYIAFLDSDDYVKKNSYVSLIHEAKNNNVDIINADANLVYDDKPPIRKTKKKEIYEICDGKKFLIESIKNKNMSMNAPLSIVKLSFIKENKFLFKSGIIHEDELWTPIIYLHAKRVQYSNVVFYMHYQRENSIMHSPNKSKGARDLINICNELNFIYNSSDIVGRDLKILNDYLVTLYLNAIFIGNFTHEKNDKEFLLKNAKSLRNRIKVLLYIFSPSQYCKINKISKRRLK